MRDIQAMFEDLEDRVVVLQSPIHSPVDRAILYGQCGGESGKKGDGAKGEAMCVCVERGAGPGQPSHV